jgi:hypothetical protein
MPLLVGNGSALATAAYFGTRDTVELLIPEGALVNLPLQDGSFANALSAAERVLDSRPWEDGPAYGRTEGRNGSSSKILGL